MIGSSVASFSALMLPLAAGGFIYIAGSDLIPELHKDPSPSRAVVQLVGMATGVALMLLLILAD
jgi:zinc and cadmium transporter